MQPVQSFIDQLDRPWQRAMCQNLLDIQSEAATPLDQAIKWQNPYFSYHGQAVLKWYVAKDWINVYFFKGSQLGDPSNLFEPTDNKTMRTIRIFADSSFNPNAYRQLVDAAIELTN